MKQIVIISGKGGTGKTSVTAAFAALADNAVLADCDVDAPDLHLILQPAIQRREVFPGGNRAEILSVDCTGCGVCLEVCRFGAVSQVGDKFRVEAIGCEGCGVCVKACPVRAIDFPEREGGEWYVSNTRFGPLVHARLMPGAENSGRLVALVREQAVGLAKEQQRDLVIIDGPPGIGCPVIASLTGADLAVVVTEPTLSGAHDWARVMELTLHFRIPVALLVNKSDLNPELTEQIERDAQNRGVFIAGRLPYDGAFTEAQRRGLSVAELDSAPVAEPVSRLWKRIKEKINHE